MIKIITVGKKPDAIYRDAIDYFERKIKYHTKFEWVLIPHSGLEGMIARNSESEKILSLINNEAVILFDQKGDDYSAEYLAEIVVNERDASRNITCIIGGAHGVNESIANRANYILRFGSTVFPHQLVRLMVAEQLYRAYSISTGSRYHHE